MPGGFAPAAAYRQLPHRNPEQEAGPAFRSSVASALHRDQFPDGRPLFSAFGLFNTFPPEPPVKSPDEVSIEISDGTSESREFLLGRLPAGFPEFQVLENGVLAAGKREDIEPLGVFRLPGGMYVAAYLHNNYETSDGEGISIEVSGLFLDTTGELLHAAQELSSWFEYEGAIRIRNLVHFNGCFATTEQVHDPVERGPSGSALSYKANDEPRVVRQYHVCASDH